jgi:hypothetical protein
MRILLDERIDEELCHYFTGHECQTCRFAKLRGLTNGALLAAAEAAGFQVLITVDRNMPHQQRMVGRKIAPTVLQSQTTILEDLATLIPEVLRALKTLAPGEVLRVRGRAEK